VDNDRARLRNWNDRENRWGMETTDQARRGPPREQRQARSRRFTDRRGSRDTRRESDWGWNDWRGGRTNDWEGAMRGSGQAQRFTDRRGSREARNDGQGWRGFGGWFGEP